jgi:hypothetical protein
MRLKGDKNAEVETKYTTVMKYLCPVRGWVEEEVEIKRYRSLGAPEGKVLEMDISTFRDED